MIRKPVVFNLDDFCESIMTAELWAYVFRLKDKCPSLKITMFTVPYLCSRKWLRRVKKHYPWIEMHYHGSWHQDRNEWFGRTTVRLPYAEYFFKGFKAPWWRMDQVTADWFNARGYVVSSKRGRFCVSGPKVYLFDTGRRLMKGVAYESSYRSIHSHVQRQRDRKGLPDIFDEISSLLRDDDEFLFVSELFGSYSR